MKQCDTVCTLFLCRLQISLNLAMIHEPTPSKLWQATAQARRPAGRCKPGHATSCVVVHFPLITEVKLETTRKLWDLCIG